MLKAIARRLRPPAPKDDRLAEFRSNRWQHDGGVSRRRYGSYAEYEAHQVAKLGDIEPKLRANAERALAKFVARFRQAPEIAGPTLCLGARIGTEVRALHAIGVFAVGIDLNPGADNPFVLKGDFHALQFPDGSAGSVYTNCLDHVFDLPRFAGEVRRVLRPGGVFLADVVRGYEEGFIAGEFEAMHWPRVEPFLATVAEAGGFALERATPVDEPWIQAVFRRH